MILYDREQQIVIVKNTYDVDESQFIAYCKKYNLTKVTNDVVLDFIEDLELEPIDTISIPVETSDVDVDYSAIQNLQNLLNND